jgi:hypothetical protein
MFKNLNRKDFHLFFHLFGFSLVAIGMSFSKVLMSLGTMLVLLNILIEADFKQYWENLKSNSVIKWLIIYFLLHLIGFIWSTNYAYAIGDIRTKSTILILPLVLVSKPISQQNLKLLYIILVSSVVLSTLINFLNYKHIIGHHTYHDIREMSLFGSHIRFSILIVLSISIIFRYLKNNASKKLSLLLIIIVCWLLYYTFYSQVLTGIISLITVIILYTFIQLYRKNNLILIGICSILIFGIYFIFNFLKPETNSQIDFKKLPKITAEGNPYKNDYTLKGRAENGPISLSICDKELEREWNKKSTISYYGRDSLNQRIRTTIIRYLSSKNLNKDATGIDQLTSVDIESIEKGIANVNENKTGLISRLYGLKYQLQNNEDPNGHSLLQRLEFWRAAIEIVKNNWLIGVGTGDVQIAFNKEYSLNHTKLKPENRLRAHNYYLTNIITFGIIGLFIFIVFIGVFIKLQLKNKNILGLLFISVFCVTALIEDTIETQLGATIFAFFIAIYSMRKQEIVQV